VQYRGQLMPLVMMDPAQKLGSEGRQPVLVFADRHRTMGLVVEEIVDIVEGACRSSSPPSARAMSAPR
jgi:two-component system, chemotaxis family, sensor kinase CheA